MDRAEQVGALFGDEKFVRAYDGTVACLATGLARARELGLDLDEAEIFAVFREAVSRALASEHPDGALPCSSCGASVVTWNGGRLDADARRSLEQVAPPRRGLRVVK